MSTWDALKAVADAVDAELVEARTDVDEWRTTADGLGQQLTTAEQAGARMAAELADMHAVAADKTAEIERLRAEVAARRPFLVGAAIGGNADPGAVETRAGATLGIRRTYWDLSKVAAAVATAKADLVAGRVPFLSFKVGAWTAAADGAVDDQVQAIADALGTLGGRIMVVIHHEPEGDEADIGQWVRMQQRLLPILADAGLEVGICLTGYHQRPDQPTTYQLATIWPEGAGVQFVAFDAYQLYGSKNGTVLKWSDWSPAFAHFGAFCAAKGVAWGLGETGLSDRAAQDLPAQASVWITEWQTLLRKHGASFLAYFDSNLNSSAVWAITPGTSKAWQFDAALRASKV